MGEYLLGLRIPGMSWSKIPAAFNLAGGVVWRTQRSLLLLRPLNRIHHNARSQHLGENLRRLLQRAWIDGICWHSVATQAVERLSNGLIGICPVRADQSEAPI